MIKDILVFIFGSNAKVRFKRIVIFISIAAFFFVAAVNVSCGFDSSGKFYFNWSNIDTTVEIKK